MQPRVDALEVRNNKMPAGIPYIIGNEAAERYSFYGMKSILTIFFVSHLGMKAEESKVWYHLFVTATYFIPIAGALLSDIFWGKYKTIMWLSVVYCIGHFVLALFDTQVSGVFAGCLLIAIGAGGIKPCVSAHVGDQFDQSRAHLFEKAFTWFYLSINAGAVIAYITAPQLLDKAGPALAFGLPGLLMVIATLVFYAGRNKFITIKPAGWQVYKQELFSKKGAMLVLKLVPLYLFLAVFWSLYDQTGGAWVLQADSPLMDKHVNLGFVEFDFYPSQIGFLNPLMIVAMVPLFSIIIYPALGKITKLNYTRKIAIGFFIAFLSFALISWVQMRMDAGHTMSILWQMLGYFILTIAEIMISITALEFSYTQAPNSMKSFIMSFYLVAVAIGNFFTAMVNVFIANPDGSSKLAGASYFWFFTILMVAAAVVFIFYAGTYKEQTFVQDEKNAVH
ncbi:MAG: POT family MFS transporter [Chitinophagales bacterium]|nr:POT family MFS transporter [Chitinophagales bacterium]